MKQPAGAVVFTAPRSGAQTYSINDRAVTSGTLEAALTEYNRLRQEGYDRAVANNVAFACLHKLRSGAICNILLPDRTIVGACRLTGKFISSWDELAALVPRFTEGGWVFRGQSHDHPMISKVGRFERVTKIEERKALREFTRRAGPYIQRNPAGDLEWLAIAQHHGMPTRLLDWTESFLVAAYFAVQAAGTKGIGTIYGIKAGVLLKGSENPFALKRTRFYKPPHISPRIPAQSGVFVVTANPTEPFEDGGMEKWHIADKKLCFHIKAVLDVCGINQSSLFPGLDGLASSLEWRLKWNKPTRLLI